MNATMANRWKPEGEKQFLACNFSAPYTCICVYVMLPNVNTFAYILLSSSLVFVIKFAHFSLSKLIEFFFSQVAPTFEFHWEAGFCCCSFGGAKEKMLERENSLFYVSLRGFMGKICGGCCVRLSEDFFLIFFTLNQIFLTKQFLIRFILIRIL